VGVKTINVAQRFGIVAIACAMTAQLSGAQGTPMSAMHDMSHDTVTAEPVLGTIDFPTSANAASHKAFIRGVLLMHNFHYPQAAIAFQEAEKLDPTNVMGYWGEAMTYSHPVWNQQDTAAANRALRRLAPTREARLALARSANEGLWLESAETLYAPSGTKAQRDTAWSAALGRMHAMYPDDNEATTFYALSLLGLNQGEREPVAYQKAYELVLPVFRAHPHHPGAAHYLIHATDDPDHAALGLQAAEAYADIAPSAGHAIHMTSHIFLALGKWDDVVAANKRALAANKSGVYAGHVVHWLHYGLIQQGRYKEADAWLDTMVRQAHGGSAARQAMSWDAAGLMAGANLADTRRWTGVAGSVRVDTAGFIATGSPEAMEDVAAAEFAEALGELNRGEVGAYMQTITAMRDRRTALAANPLMATAVGMSDVMEKTLRAYVRLEAGDSATALAAFREAADEEAKLPMPFGPPMTIKPPREAAGELLLSMGRAAEAKKEFQMALARTPRRTVPMIGLARAEWALGNRDAARGLYKELVGIWHSADTEFPELVEARERGR
jgi:tetratricopeptide (TPR) repeat protein